MIKTKHHISPQRLSKIIAIREWQHAQHSLLEIYEAMTPSQRQAIKEHLKIICK